MNNSRLTFDLSKETRHEGNETSTRHPSDFIIDTRTGVVPSPSTADDNDVVSEVSSLRDNSIIGEQMLLKVMKQQRQREQQQRRRRRLGGQHIEDHQDSQAQKEQQEEQEEEVAGLDSIPSARATLRLDTLHGRQKEMCLLQASYDRVASTGRSEAILVKGKSGSGKSQLVDMSLRHHVSTKNGGGLYASGKYDQMLKNGDPYSSALASALEEVCALLRSVERQDRNKEGDADETVGDINSAKASERIRSVLEPEDLQLLQQWIPSLRDVGEGSITTSGDDVKVVPRSADAEEGSDNVSVVGETASTFHDQPQSPVVVEDVTSQGHHRHHDAVVGPPTTTSLARFKTLLQILLRCVASPKHPLVMFLDDLQWADPASLQLLQALLTDSQSHHTLFICTIREEELDICCTKSSFLKEWIASTSLSSTTKTGSRATPMPGGSNANRLLSASYSLSRTASSSALIMPTTMMRIGNLQVSTLNQLLTHALDLKHHQSSSSSSTSKGAGTSTSSSITTTKTKSSSTLKLAQVVYKKTGGRPHCVVAFLHCLVAESLLVHHHQQHQQGRDGSWTWDLERIQALTDVSDSVVPVLMRRVERLPQDTTWALQVASCLGHDFDGMLLKEYIIRELMAHRQTEGGEDDEDETATKHESDAASSAPKRRTVYTTSSAPAAERQFQAAISVALRSGLIEAAGGIHQYKFTHDTIQRCFYDLMKPSVQAERHWVLGQQLLIRWKEQHRKQPDEERAGMEPPRQQQERMFFLMVDQLNRGAKAIPTLKDRKDLIALNIEAGERARSISAFAVAANLLRSAHELMVDTDGEIQKWSGDDYDLTLKVCTTLAEYEGLSGNFAESHVMTDEIVAQARTFQNKLPAYSIHLDGLSAQGRFRDGFNLGFPLLEQLGESFPTKPKVRHVLREMIRVSARLCRSKSEDKLLKLPEMTDPIRLESMKLMKRLCSFAMFLDDANFAALLSMRMLRRTLSYGISIPSAYAITIWSITQATLSNTTAAYRYGCVALAVLKRLDAEDACPATIAMVYGGALHWKMPHAELAPIFHRAYAVGFRSGDVAYAFMAAYNSVMAQFYTNESLVDMERTLRENVNRMKEFGQDSAWLTAVPFLQMIQNLMNESDDPLVLSGDAMVQEDVLQKIEESNNIGSWMALHMSRWTLSMFFCKWDLAQICASNIADKAMVAKAHFSCLDYITHFTMTALVSPKAVRQQRVPRRAKQAMKSLQRWHQDGKEDALSPLLLLEAECACVKNKTNVSKLEDLYRKAAEDASSRISLRARALERCGQVLSKRGAPKSRVKEILLEAQNFYEEWGASAKVIHLEDAIKSLCE